MISRVLADIVLLVHFAFIVFALFGGLLALRVRWSVWVHLPAVLWSSMINLFSWTCPLTPLENLLRSRAGLAGYRHSFVQHYIGAVVYPAGLPRHFELIAAVTVIVLNVLAYWFVLHRIRRK